jgi:exopolysaccharide production protein ExoQ
VAMMAISEVGAVPPAHKLVITWGVVLLMLYFATLGQIRTDTATSNNPYVAHYQTLALHSANQGENLIRDFVLLAAGLMFISKARAVRWGLRSNPTLVLLALLSICSCIWSQNPTRSLQNAIFLIANLLLAAFCVQRFDSERLTRVIYLGGWALLAINIAVSLAFPQYGLDHRGADSAGAWIGIYPHKNVCCIVSVFMMSVAFYIKAAAPLAKLLRTIYIALSLLIIFLSQSRTGWIVLTVCIAYVTFVKLLHAFEQKDRRVVAIVALACLCMGVVASLPYYGVIVSVLGKDSTFTGRTGIWQLVFDSVMKRPILGYGYGAFWSGLQGESANISLASGWIVPHAHDGLLNVWLELGGVGLVLVIILFGRAIVDGWSCLKRGESRYAEWHLCLLVLTVASNVSELTILVPNHLAWILCMVACIGLREEASRLRVNRQQNGISVQLQCREPKLMQAPGANAASIEGVASM